mgnify:FL=1
MEELRHDRQLSQELGFTLGKDLKLGGLIDTPAGMGVLSELFAEGMACTCIQLSALAQFTIGRKDLKEETLLHSTVIKQVTGAIQEAKEMNAPLTVLLPEHVPTGIVQRLAGMGVTYMAVPSHDVPGLLQSLA